MKRATRSLAALAAAALWALALPVCQASAGVKVHGGMYIVDDAEGYAPVKDGNRKLAREEAKRMAYRDALEKALGACVTGVTEMENYEVTRDKVFSKASGLVKDFKVVSERVDEDGVLTLTGICKVEERALDGALGPDVIAMLGNPRIMILVDERIGEKVPFISATESEALRTFERAGYLIVDPDQARTLLRLDPSSAFDDPVKLTEAARTLKADIIVVGRAYADKFAQQKVHGITLYGVKGTVQLKAVLTKTAYQVSSKTVESATGKKPAQTVEGGAERCFREATAQAADQIVYKIAYNLASAGSALGGVTVNVRLAEVSFQDAERIGGLLRELAGKGGEVFERSYKGRLLELDVVSDKTARSVAAFLSENGVEVEELTAQSIEGRIRPKKAEAPAARAAAVSVHITGVPSFKEAGALEDALNELAGTGGSISAEFVKGTFQAAVTGLTARQIADFLSEKGVEIEGVSADSVAGRVAGDGKRGGLW